MVVDESSRVRQWRIVLVLLAALLQSSLIYAAAPLQKVVFVFAGFNERTSFIFVAMADRGQQLAGIVLLETQARSRRSRMNLVIDTLTIPRSNNTLIRAALLFLRQTAKSRVMFLALHSILPSCGTPSRRQKKASPVPFYRRSCCFVITTIPSPGSMGHSYCQCCVSPAPALWC